MYARACSRLHTCLFKRSRHTSATFSYSCTATPTWTVLRVARVTHVRAERGRGSEDKYLKWAFFHRCYVTWQTHLLCDETRSDCFRGGLSGSGQPSRYHPSTQTKRRGGGRGGGWEIHWNYKLLRRWIFLETFIVFPVAVPPSVPALTCTPRGTSP